jgi:hypothetical protein
VYQQAVGINISDEESSNHDSNNRAKIGSKHKVGKNKDNSASKKKSNEVLCCGKLVITTEISGSDKYQQGVSVVRGGVSESMMEATASVLQSQI